MDAEAYLKVFERKLVHHCAPTLANVKPANLFTCRDESVPNLGGALCGTVSAEEHERNLQFALRETRERLYPHGVHIELLARRASGVLLCVYRPDAIRARLADPDVSAFLSRYGYDPASLSACIELLHRRICGTDLKSTLSASCAFPHEIGLFLGYPLEDVVGFIENGGENYLCTGCWKVYSRQRDAEESFCRFKESTAACEALFDSGVPIERLAARGQACRTASLDRRVG